MKITAKFPELHLGEFFVNFCFYFSISLITSSLFMKR
jgi:hypothetical protein